MGTMGYEAVIGLEVHAQLSTATKLFCGCPTTFGAEPNAQTCPVCLGLPGALPVLNRKAVAFAVKFGLAIGNDPVGTSVFARKNYFYPDLPKGYQISQYERPVVGAGSVPIRLENGTLKNVRINRAHLEEDAGQSAHEGWPQSREKSYVNLNRAGVPLLEIVTEPDLRSAEEAYVYLNELKTMLQYLDICDGNMEEGSLRCDANVSVRPSGTDVLGTRTELKNLNSFNNVRRAIQHEINRQITIVSQGGEIDQCTLLWDVNSQSTKVMRTKEDSHDYRYFPEPDLPPLAIDRALAAEMRQTLPELPGEKLQRFFDRYGLSPQDAGILVSDKNLAAYFERVAGACANAKTAANWILTELLRELKRSEAGIGNCPVPADHLAGLISSIENRTISGKIAKKVFAEMFATGKDPETIILEKGLRQITDEETLRTVVRDILDRYPDQVAEFRGGKTKVFGFFVGEAMKATKGKANPALINQLLSRELEGAVESPAKP